MSQRIASYSSRFDSSLHGSNVPEFGRDNVHRWFGAGRFAALALFAFSCAQAQDACQTNPFGERFVAAEDLEAYVLGASGSANTLFYGTFFGFQNQGNFFRTQSGQTSSGAVGPLDFDLTTADLNNDGRAELVAAFPTQEFFSDALTLIAVDPRFTTGGGGIDEDKDEWRLSSSFSNDYSNVAISAGNMLRRPNRPDLLLAAARNDGLRAFVQADNGPASDRSYFSPDGTIFRRWRPLSGDPVKTSLDDNFRNVDVTVADLDGDGFDDEGIVVNLRENSGIRLSIFEGSSVDMESLAEINLVGGDTIVGVESGDFDGDGRDEFAVLSNASSTSSPDLNSFIEVRIFEAPTDGTGCLPLVAGALCVKEIDEIRIDETNNTAAIAVGNTRGDAREEVIIGYSRPGVYTRVETWKWPARASSFQLHNRFDSALDDVSDGQDGLDRIENLVLAAGDLEEQGKDQIIAAFRQGPGVGSDSIRLEDRECSTVGEYEVGDPCFPTENQGFIYHRPTEDFDKNRPDLIDFSIPNAGTNAFRKPLVALADYDNDTSFFEQSVLPGAATDCRVVVENQVKNMVFMPPVWSGFDQQRQGWIGRSTSEVTNVESSTTGRTSHSQYGYVGIGFDAGALSASVKATASKNVESSGTVAAGSSEGLVTAVTWTNNGPFLSFDSTEYACFTYQLRKGGADADGFNRLCALNGVVEETANVWAWTGNSGYRRDNGASLRWIPPHRDWANLTLINGTEAIQSSTLSPFTGAGKAINNVTGNSDYSQTQTETNPWIQIDLGEAQIVDTVRIFNREGFSGANLTGHSVFVGNRDFTTIANDPDVIDANPEVTFSSLRRDSVFYADSITTWNNNDEPVVGRYVKVMLEGTASLALSEIKVFGPPDVDVDRHPVSVRDTDTDDGRFEVGIFDPFDSTVRFVEIEGELIFNGYEAGINAGVSVGAGGASLQYVLSDFEGDLTGRAKSSSNSTSVGVEFDVETGFIVDVSFGGGTEFSSGVTQEEARTVSVTDSFDIGGQVDGTPNLASTNCNYSYEPFYYTQRITSDTGYQHDVLVVDYAVPDDFDSLDRGLDLSSCKNELAPIPTDALIAHWPLDGNADDISGNQYDGQLAGSAGFANGALGQALDLRGGQGWIDLPGNILNQLNSCSMSAWINLASYDPGDPSDSSFNAIYYEDDNLAGALANSLILSDSPEVGWTLSGLSGLQGRVAAPPIGQWVHHVMTYNAQDASYRIYRDGVLAEEGVHKTSPAGSPIPKCGSGLGATIGAWDEDGNGSMTRFFDGLIDDVRLYGRQLNESDAASLFEARLPNNIFRDSFEVNPARAPR